MGSFIENVITKLSGIDRAHSYQRSYIRKSLCELKA